MDQPTLWSTILRARDARGDEQLESLGRLLLRYRCLIRLQIAGCLRASSRSTDDLDDLDDLTQGFIEHCLQQGFLRHVDPSKGRFRTFLRACIRNYLIERYRRGTAAKRDFRRKAFSLNETIDEGEEAFEPIAPAADLDEVLDRQWAMDLVARAMESLADECQKSRRSRVFDALRGSLLANDERHESLEVARGLGLSEVNIRVALHRLRARLGELIREEVRQTVGSTEDWREELAYLVQLMGKRPPA